MKIKILIFLCSINIVPIFASKPAPNDPYSKLPQVKKRIEMPQKQEKKCTICLEKLDIKDKQLQTLHCNAINPQAQDHTFHKECIAPWLKKDQISQCPICRTSAPQLNSFTTNLLKQANESNDINRKRKIQLELGKAYLYGSNEVFSDYAQAKYFLNRANQKDAPIDIQREAQLRLARIYLSGGNGIAQDLDKTIFFLNQANQKDAPIDIQRYAQYFLAHTYRLKGQVTKSIDFLNQANQKDAPIELQREVQFALGRIYREGGFGIIQDLQQANFFLTQANQEDASISIQRHAQLELGKLYQEGGNGIAQDLKKAKRFLSQANQDDASDVVRRDAQAHLAQISADNNSDCVVQ